ncbi:hypothetical protein GCM10027051_01430 [Niabella terrae]
MIQKSVIISGGGSKGAFAVGVVKDLMNLYQLDFEILVGTSTGSLMVPLIALGELEALEQLYTSVTDADILVKYNLGERLNTASIFTTGPLTKKINALFTDDFYDRLIQSGKAVYLTTVCLQTGRLVVYTTGQHTVSDSYYELRPLLNADQFRRAVLASASQPVFMPPVKVDKLIPGASDPEFQFVDGGVREYAGIGIAMDAGARELFTISLAARTATPVTAEYRSLFQVLEQTIAIFITDVSTNDFYQPRMFNEGLRYIQQVKDKMKAAGITEAAIQEYFTVAATPGPYQHRPPCKLHLIQPELPLGGGPGGLVFNPTEMTAMVTKGRLALQSYVAQLEPGDTDWA